MWADRRICCPEKVSGRCPVAAASSRNVIFGEAPARTTVDRLRAKHDGLDPGTKGIEAIVRGQAA